jgi:hypothetical protein
MRWRQIEDRGIHPLSTTVAADPWTGWPTHSTPAVFEKFLEVFEALRGEGGCRNVGDAQDGKATVLGLHVHGDLFEAFHLFTEHSGNAGDRIDVTRRGHGHTAFAGGADLVQFQGSSSANREAGWSAMRASTSASQARINVIQLGRHDQLIHRGCLLPAAVAARKAPRALDRLLAAPRDGRKVVVVTHHAPHPVCLQEDWAVEV